ncbi:MAG: GC-type dockerin domain-anchored protein [Phycisphaerales bacterium]
MTRSWFAIASILIPAGSVLAVDRLVPSQYPTIQSAINAAAAGDSVVVAPGTYTGTGNRDINPLGKAITIRSASGAALTIIDCQGTQATPRRGFQVSSGTSSLVIDGFTIRNGYSSDGGAIWVFGNASPVIKNMVIETSGATRGGGAYFFGAGTPAFQNCSFRQNTATFGGGVCEIGSGTATFTDCTFDANTATDHGAGGWVGSGPSSFLRCTFSNGNATNGGGGVHVDGAGNTSFASCSFQSNAAVWGAGLRLWNGSVVMTDCTFEMNAASDRGGGILADQPNSTVALTRVVFQQNSAGNYGGGLGAEGINGTGMVTVNDCVFDRNTAAQYTGGARMAWSKSTFAGTTFTGNSAPVVGGLALDGDSSSPGSVSFCTFENNSATADWGNGGGLEVNGNGITVNVADSTFRGNSANGDFFNGGAGICVWFDNEIVTISRCLFENNSMPRGNGAGVFVGPNGTNIIEDCTFQGNSAYEGAAVYDFGGPMTLRRCVIQNNTGNWGGGGTIVVHREWDNFASAIISDCTIKNNIAPGDAGLTVSPAGSSAIVTNTIFEGNQSLDLNFGSGGATVLYGAIASFADCVFRSNQGTEAGGVWVSEQAEATIRHCVFDQNASPHDVGGLAFHHGATGLVEDCQITSNTGAATGGLSLGARGLVVRRTQITGNFSGQSAGGIRLSWGDTNDPQTYVFEDCDVSANTATWGSGIDISGGGVVASFTRCNFTLGTSLSSAGAIVAQFSPKVFFAQCNVTDNNAAGSGSALYVAQGADVTFKNGEISRNTSGAEGAFFVDTGFNTDPTTLVIEDTPITDNVSASIGVMNLRFTNASAVLRRCAVERNLAQERCAGINVEWGGALTVDSCTFADNMTANGGGGALYIDTGSTASITTTNFMRNSAAGAGAIGAAFSSQVLVDTCQIADNSTSGSGSALVVTQGADMIFKNGEIARNTSGAEGAIFVDTGFNSDPTTLVIEDTPITDNVSASIGVMNLRFTNASAVLRRCAVERNLAQDRSAGFNVEWGGALTLDACTVSDNTTVSGQTGAINVHTGSSAVVTSTDFLRNTASTVGAVRVANSGTTLTMDRCRLIGNTAQNWVGAIHAEDAGVGTITNTLIASNASPREAAVAAWWNNAQLNLINCDVVHNTGMAAIWSDLSGVVNVRNSIVRDNTINMATGSGVINASHSNIQGGWAGTGNISGDPHFVDPNGVDNVLGTIDDDYTLADGSPCIDAGDNAMIPGGILLDLAGQSRRIDVVGVPDTGWGVAPIVDMGAFEHLAGACLADFNADGFVNGDDYDAFAEFFEAGDLGADINHDGFVNGDDYDLFAEAFEAGC